MPAQTGSRSDCPTCGRPLLHAKLREHEGLLVVVCEHGHPWYVAGVQSKLGELDTFNVIGPAPAKHTKPYPRCVFCGEKADSREHAIPAWMSKRLGIKEYLPADNLGTGAPVRKQPVSFASFRARIFCSTCNTHFKHLEDAVIPLIVPMAKGRVLSLAPESQALLALWASKTAMALMVASNAEFSAVIPLEHRHSVRIEHRPPSAMWIGYLRWQGKTVFTAAEGKVTPKTAARTTHSYPVYGSIFAFAQLAFSVVGFIDALDPRDVIAGDRSATPQFWPPTGARLITWPPPMPATSDLVGLLGFVPLRRDG